MTDVFQDWTKELPWSQKVLLAYAMRGPDGVRKDHSIYAIMRAYKAAILKTPVGLTISPSDPGSSILDATRLTDEALWKADIKEYFVYREQLPFLFNDHLRRAVQVVGFRHFDRTYRDRFYFFYAEFCRTDNVNIETLEMLNKRLPI
jgi:hypothetical protein